MSVCANCEAPVVETLGGSIHLDGFYSCSVGSPGVGGFADPLTQGNLDDAHSEGYEKGRAEAEQEFDDSLADREDDARREGRADGIADAIRALEDLS
ncbi:hypothetical protein SEA_LIGMA_52 [Gordonia phage Ligma]|nr:hypothetical protein SEA_LIGMA_52 [Gordonia phage Ligma]UQT02151.1 hypothetical protein SEA_AXUMITE_52 [Gordonia phage Axumite]